MSPKLQTPAFPTDFLSDFYQQLEVYRVHKEHFTPTFLIVLHILEVIVSGVNGLRSRMSPRELNFLANMSYCCFPSNSFALKIVCPDIRKSRDYCSLACVCPKNPVFFLFLSLSAVGIQGVFLISHTQLGLCFYSANKLRLIFGSDPSQILTSRCSPEITDNKYKLRNQVQDGLTGLHCTTEQCKITRTPLMALVSDRTIISVQLGCRKSLNGPLVLRTMHLGF